jgi:peptidoglycan/xylan/chitin deacetylase (PgdA/CDA1 family)
MVPTLFHTVRPKQAKQCEKINVVFNNNSDQSTGEILRIQKKRSSEIILYSCGSNHDKKIALTFDDGPGQSTKEILQILKKVNAKATFFMLGERIQKNPELAKEVFALGHEIANHTYEHKNFYDYNGEDKMHEMEKGLLKCEKIIKKMLNVKPFFVRFPYGYAKHDAIKVARDNGYYVVNWSFGIDWAKIGAEEMHRKYKHAIRNGAIFLMHDLPKNSKVLLFLEAFVNEIKEAGYEIVTLSNLLNIKPDNEK